MNLLFNKEKNKNDKNEENEFYYFNSNDDIFKNLEFDRKSYFLEMSYNLDRKISDYELSNEDFQNFTDEEIKSMSARSSNASSFSINGLQFPEFYNKMPDCPCG